MSQLGAAVHVVTTAGPAGNAGFTATAVVSVSDQPATLLVCLNRRSQVAPILCGNRGRFASTRCAPVPTPSPTCSRGARGVPMVERFNTGSWSELSTGAPTLTDAAVALDCRVLEIKVVGTHNVVFAGVVAVRLGQRLPRWSITSGRTSRFETTRCLCFSMPSATALPLFHLYGDPPDDQAFDFIHVETIASRS